MVCLIKKSNVQLSDISDILHYVILGLVFLMECFHFFFTFGNIIFVKWDPLIYNHSTLGPVNL